MKIKEELYRITDNFLTESTNEKGEYRSIDRLNEDRHLAIEALSKLIKEILEELKMEKHTDKFGGEARCRYNDAVDEINSKIDKLII